MSRRSRLFLAAVAGLLVGTLAFVALYAATPDRGLHRGVGEVAWERFQFQAPEAAFTAGSVARLVNGGPVQLEVVWQGPDGTSGSVLLPPGGTANLTLSAVGEYVLGAASYPWGEVKLEVRSANPLVRLVEDVRDFEPRSRRTP